MRFALLPAFLLGVGAMTAAPASAQDSAQICMFRCAPQLGEKGYDQCLEECFSSGEWGNEDDAGAPAASADISPLFGFWQASHTPCGKVSDDSWHIDASGASPYESMCALRAASRAGDTFTLDQECTFYEDEVEVMTTRVSLLGRNAIEIGDVRYQRCER